VHALRTNTLLAVMTRPLQSIAFFAALVLLLVAYMLSSIIPADPWTPKLSVMFVGMTNNPMRQMTPTRVEVTQGATGFCALFWVTNITAKQFVWFKTASIEQRTEAGWEPLVPSGGSWSGVEGSLWSPRYGCLIAVGWPPGLATNATWRLQVRYGRDPSTFGLIVNQKTGREFFKSGKEEATIPSDEVTQ
jgi:hypothetical protein